MRLSVIIPAYEHLVEVLGCLNSLQAMQEGTIQYIVADDASPTVFFPAVIGPQVAQVVRAEHNQGFAGNCNLGAREAAGEVLFFVNQDVFGHGAWSQGWDTALLRRFMESPQAGIVGARLLFPNLSIQNAGGLFDARRQPFHRCLGYANPLWAEVNTARAVSWTTGAALAIRREVFEQVGGFDTAYRGGYFEDVDLCMKVRAAGWQVWYEPGCTLVHVAGTSGGSPYFMRNAALFRQRWYDRIEPDTYTTKVAYW